tara:strand:- start:1627 stop:2538 length:912 start_codon:yes stop_codon:yes gene_type:complete
MTVYLNKIKENWIVDRLRKEWYENNQDISTEKIKSTDVIWIIAPWQWKNIRKKYLLNKKVICSIYHIDFTKFSKDEEKDFYLRDKFVSEYHVISHKTKEQVRQMTDKKITSIPFWVNQNIFFEIKDKNRIKEKYGLDKDKYYIGSFQRDTEGNDLKSPKLIKGPDRFVEIVKSKFLENKKIEVILTGKRRQYVINELKKLEIPYKYLEMVNFQSLNELYNILDLYIVSSRLEGGPQAIVECGINKTPIISTDVGVASEILSPNSIFNMGNYGSAEADIDYAYKNSIRLTIPNGFEKFYQLIQE